jgi:hypothetical protein
MTYDEEEEAKRRVEYERTVDLKLVAAQERKLQEENLEKILKKQKK